MGIDWKHKLSSRKFWAALIGFITPLMVLMRIDEVTIAQVIGVVSACSVLISYILGEGMVDAARLNKEGELTHDE